MILLRSILKSHVSATSYVNEHGTAVNRREHEDSRQQGIRYEHHDTGTSKEIKAYAKILLAGKHEYEDEIGHVRAVKRGDKWEATSISVNESHRRKGIATTLLHRMHQETGNLHSSGVHSRNGQALMDHLISNGNAEDGGDGSKKYKLFKSHVAAYDRVSKTGALSHIREHEDHRVRSYARKILGSKDSYDLHQIRKERFGHLPHWNKLDEHTRHAIVDAEEEKAKSHKEFEEWVETHGSKKGKKKDSVKVDRSGWEQQLMFKSRRVQHVAYILRKSHIPTEVVTNESGTTFVRQEHEDKRDMFIRTASGTVRFGTVSAQTAKEANIAPGAIILKHGEHTGPHKGYGRKHIEAEHGKEIAAAGFNSPEDFVQYVATNFNAIYPAKKGRIALVVEGPPQQVAIVELKKNKKGGFYSVYTAYPPKKPKFTGTALWRSRQPSQSASGVQPSLHVGQNAHPVVATQSLSYPTSTSDQNASGKTNISLPENKFNKSHNPLHLIRKQ